MMAVPPDYSVPLPFYGASLPDVYPPMNHGLDYNLPPPIPVPHSSVSQPLNPFPIPTNVPPPNMATYSTVPPPPIDSAQGAYYYNDYNNYYSKMGSYGYSTENYDYSNSSTLNSDLYYESRPSIISSEHHNDPSPYYSYDNTHNNESRLHRNRSYRSSRSPSQSRLRRSHSFSPPKYYRDRDKCYREKSYYREGKDYNRYDRKFYSPERRHSPRRQSPRRHSLRGLSPRRHSPRRHSPRRHSPIRLSPRRHSPKQNRPRRFTPDRRYSPGRRHTPGRRYTPERYHSYSAIRYEESRHSRRSSTVQDSCSTKESVRPDRGTPVELSDREKILREYRKNYCSTSEDLIKKMEQWSREQDCDNEKSSKMWYRSSPAELYYTPVEGNRNMQQTQKLTRLCETFFVKLIERGRKARPEIDELPPLKPQKPKLCKHKFGNDKLSSSSSSDSEESLDEDGLQGYADRVMMELQRKQNHPRRLHPEMWFNNPGEMNGGPLCRCSARARRHGMRHGVYAGEETFPRCILTQNNIDRLYHYRITVSPPTNFLIKMPTIINHDEHEFLFSGFSMFTHYKLSKLPTCKVIRFNIEYTILYVEEPMPQNFTVQELDLFEEYLFTELLELVDLDLGKSTDTTCSQFHFMPRFVRNLSEGGCEVLSMCEVLKYLINRSGLLIPPEMLDEVHEMDHYTWQKFIDKIKGMIVTNPGKKPCSVRVDQLDRSPPVKDMEKHNSTDKKKYYPEIVHFGIRPPQLSYAGNPEYQKAWRFYVKYRHLIANMSKPSYKDRQKLSAKENRLQEMRTQSNMKRDVTVAISSEGFHTTGLMCDVVQHAMLIPVLVRHLRFHKSLDSLEKKIGYSFKTRALLQTALTHPSYRENFGTTPDHARNSLTNCGIRQPEYGDRRIHYTRKKGIVTLINIMSRFGNYRETESGIKHNERLEFLGDAVVEFLSSIHLFRMFPGLAEGGLATYRAAIVQNQHLAQLAKNIGLECYMLYAHGSDLCREVVMRHAMANCFEALMGALFLDAGIEVADRVFALALWHNDPELQEVWCKERAHPLQEQEPLGDRKYIKDFEFLQRLTKFEDSIGIQFKHIRLLARAFTDRSVGFTHLTLGSNQRLEFLGDTVLQLVVSDKLYRHFPEHHEGHLSLLRSSLVNNRTQAMVCDDLNMSSYAIYNNPEAKPTTKKHKADLLEAFLGALYIDKNFEYCQVFCNACLFPRLQEFILNQDWNDPKSKLQQCCLTLRSMKGGEPDIPVYKVIECLGPTNTRVYTVAVYFRGARLAAARGHSIQKAEMNAAEEALNSAHALFPQLDHQKRVIAKIIKRKKRKGRQNNAATKAVEDRLSTMFFKRKQDMENVPKAYRLDKQSESSDESSAHNSEVSDNELNVPDKSDDSGLDSDTPSTSDKTDNIQVSSLLTDMQNMKEQLIKTKEYDKLKQKYKEVESDDDL